MDIKVVLLGTGTPNACYFASGPSVAVCVNEKSYIVDAGPGVVRQASKAHHLGVTPLKVSNLTTAFITHLHTDHTLGLSDLIFTPWVLERKENLKLIGPIGIKKMVEHLVKAYDVDIDMRINGFEQANETGYLTNITEISTETEEIVFTDEYVDVKALRVSHGALVSYAYKFYIKDGIETKTVLISGDTKPTDIIAENAKEIDLLIHEVEYTAGLSSRLPKWQNYHKEVHTTSEELAELLNKSKPRKTVTYHRIYHLDTDDNSFCLIDEVKRREGLILEEIAQIYSGDVVNGQDMDVFVI